MNASLRLSVVCFCFALTLQPATADEPKRLTRAESFLGIHFDFHAGKDCTEIGKNTTREMIENVLRQVRPDYIQIDCKGHAGFSSYPTKVGNQAPGFVGDPLRLWRQVTAEQGTALFMHYSGVWDSEAIVKNPGWAALNADGKPNPNATSFFSAYADQLLIPQLRELAGDYGVDGVWVDGECWASVPDYGAAALDAFSKATGISDFPRKPGEPHWFEWLEFNREQFRKYLRHYTSEVRKSHPKFQLCSNWAFTDHMPEPVTVPVDFLSGDYSPEDSVNSARLSGRYLTRQGKPWDLMAWSFTLKPGKNDNKQKTAVQLQREAAVVLALGGGFQAYFTQKRDGSVREERVPVMAEVGRFCRERQALSHRAEQVPQVAVLYSTYAHYRNINGLFSRDPGPFAGLLEALVESQYSVELLGEHHLRGRLQEYPLVVIPEWRVLDPSFVADLVAYVKAGGKLLLGGPEPAALFLEPLGAAAVDRPSASDLTLISGGERVAVKGPARMLRPGSETRRIGSLAKSPDAPLDLPAAFIAPCGQGQMAAFNFNLGRNYRERQSPVLKGLLKEVVDQLFPDPVVRVKGGAGLDVVVNRPKPGGLAIHLVNTSGPHRTEPIIEQIDPAGPVTLEILAPSAPKALTLEPGGRPLKFESRDGRVRVEVPRVDIHEIVWLR